VAKIILMTAKRKKLWKC